MKNTVHGMIPDNKNRIFCKKHDDIIIWSTQFFSKNCTSCKYFAGLGGGTDQNVVVECAYTDTSKNTAIVVDRPETQLLKSNSIVFKIKRT